MCSRCIRFMDEVAEDPVLGFIDRGTHTKLTVHPGQTLDNNYSLNTADICPVGALTSNDFRFQMRVWFLKETKSIDTNCGTGANTVIWTRGNEIFRDHAAREQRGELVLDARQPPAQLPLSSRRDAPQHPDDPQG